MLCSIGTKSFPGGSDGKESAYSSGDPGLIPWSGRSPGEGNGGPLQYSYWRIPWTEEPGELQTMGSQSRKQLSNLHTGTKILGHIHTNISVLKSLFVISFSCFIFYCINIP